jgi:hypothetical protein
MSRMFEHARVDATYLESAPARAVVRHRFDTSAARLFACLCDGEAWKLWLLDSVVWTTPLPRGIGTTRTISMGPLRADEYFFVWDENRRFAFRLDRSTMPLFGAFAEDYVIHELGAQACELEWTMAFELGGAARLGHGVTAAGMRLNNRRALARLARALFENPSRWNAASQGDTGRQGGHR